MPESAFDPGRGRNRRVGDHATAGLGPSSPLEALGLRPGQRVRFRRRAGEHWAEGVALGIEKDGSIGVRDAQGRYRALAVARIEVRVKGRGRAQRWEPLANVAARTEQLDLF